MLGSFHKLRLHLGVGRWSEKLVVYYKKVQTRDVRGQKMPKNANVICESSLSSNSVDLPKDLLLRYFNLWQKLITCMIYLLLFKLDQPFKLHRSFDTFLQSPFAKFSRVAFLRGLMYIYLYHNGYYTQSVLIRNAAKSH